MFVVVSVVGAGVECRPDSHILAEAVCRWIIEAEGDIVGVGEGWFEGVVELSGKVVQGAP